MVEAGCVMTPTQQLSQDDLLGRESFVTTLHSLSQEHEYHWQIMKCGFP